MTSELIRLDFRRDHFKPEHDYHKTGICTHAMQGKIYYMTPKGEFYTQSRDDIPERMFIRGKEFPKENYFPQLETLKGYTKFVEGKTLIMMVARQDLLITHKEMEGTQVFFLGTLDNEKTFTPAIVEYERNSYFFEANDIQIRSTYGVDGGLYIPARITESEFPPTFVHSSNGIPTTILDKQSDEIFELFSDSQNNNQLFIRIFFGLNEPATMEDIEKRMVYVSKISPTDKVEEFIVLIEKFRGFLKLFTGKKVCHGLVDNSLMMRFEYDEEDEEISRRMEKPVKSLQTLIKIIKKGLWENKNLGHTEGIPLHHQVSGALFTFFNYNKNINNCCHILKHWEKLVL